MKRIVVVMATRLALWHGLFVLVISLNACSTNQEKSENAYRQVQTVPKLKVPDDLVQPAESHSMDVPEQLDTGEIPKNLELPPTVTGVNLENLEEEATTSASDEEDSEPPKQSLQSEIVSTPDNTKKLLVQADIDTVWPRVAEALKKIGFTIEDSNRGKFYYFITREFERQQTLLDPSQPVEMGLKTPKEEHFIYVEPGEEHIEITVRNDKNAVEGTVLANQLLQSIKGYIEEP